MRRGKGGEEGRRGKGGERRKERGTEKRKGRREKQGKVRAVQGVKQQLTASIHLYYSSYSLTKEVQPTNQLVAYCTYIRTYVLT